MADILFIFLIARPDLLRNRNVDDEIRVGHAPGHVICDFCIRSAGLCDQRGCRLLGCLRWRGYNRGLFQGNAILCSRGGLGATGHEERNKNRHAQGERAATSLKIKICIVRLQPADHSPSCFPVPGRIAATSSGQVFMVWRGHPILPCRHHPTSPDPAYFIACKTWMTSAISGTECTG